MIMDKLMGGKMTSWSCDKLGLGGRVAHAAVARTILAHLDIFSVRGSTFPD